MSDEAAILEAPLTKPPTRLRRLRIAVSVFFGLLTLALCMLWVRSYKTCDIAFRGNNNGRIVNIGSVCGYTYFVQGYQPRFGGLYTSNAPGWAFTKIRTYYRRDAGLQALPTVDTYTGRVTVPYWCLTTPLVLASLLLWFPYSWRFSLRTFMLATTVIAVALGLLVWARR